MFSEITVSTQQGQLRIAGQLRRHKIRPIVFEPIINAPDNWRIQVCDMSAGTLREKFDNFPKTLKRIAEFGIRVTKWEAHDLPKREAVPVGQDVGQAYTAI